MTPRFRYPRFEENQVLSYQHLNQLTDFLEGEDRLARRALLGAGVACGLDIEHFPVQGLTLRRGVALTTAGFLCQIEEDLRFIGAADYRDPAAYAPFLTGGGAAQIALWELLETASAGSRAVVSLTDADSAAFLADKAALLYLERTTADLDTCTDNHCINQGQERRGVWRVLLGLRDELTALREKALNDDAVEPAWDLEDLRPERLLLRPADTLSHPALSERGLDFMRDSRDRLLASVQAAGALFGGRLGIPATTTSAALNALAVDFDAWLAGLRAGGRIGWQHGLDHLRHLYRAWSDFVEAAFAWESEVPPPAERFPLHALLGMIPTRRRGEPDFLRHRFVPTPLPAHGGRDRSLLEHRYRRLLTLCAAFQIPAGRGVRITPGGAVAGTLEAQAVPFYYDPVPALTWWNVEATRRQRERRLPCYHREVLLNRPEIRDPLRFPSDAWAFYRIEGHQGRTRRQVEQSLAALRRQYQLPFQVVSVTLGAEEEEATHCLCELEKIKVLHRVSADEMRCHLARLLGFLGSLLKPAAAATSVFDRITLADGTVKLAFDLQKADFLTFGVGAQADLAGGLRAVAPAASDATNTFARAAAAATAGAGDLRTVKLDNLELSYAVVSQALYPHLTPEVLVNSLARELMGRLTEADGRLDAAVEGFNADLFNETIQAARTKATDLTGALAGLSDDVEAEVLKQRGQLSQELLLFLANCVPTRIAQVASLFAQALERLRATPTLATFLRQHPGLEHLGGVPKGGTFVLVCGRPESNAAEADGVAVDAFGGFAETGRLDAILTGATNSATTFGKATSRMTASSGAAFVNPATENLLLKSYGYYQASPGANVLIEKLTGGANLSEADKTLLAGSYTPAAGGIGAASIDLEAIYDRLRRFFGDTLETEPDLVLADFCLPYLCCAECAGNPTVVLPSPPASLTLPAADFCADDPGPYPFTAQPAGGLVTGPGVVALDGGAYGFRPADVSPDEIVDGRLTFTYRIGDDTTVRLTVRLVAPPIVRFEASGPDAVEGGWTVAFRNLTELIAGDECEWTLGDGATSTAPNPTHVYTAPGDYEVGLRVIRGPCVRTAEGVTVSILEVREPPALTIEPQVFCADDPRPHAVQATPDGGRLLVNGQRVDGLLFVPADAGGSGPVELRYQLADGRSDALEVTLVAPPEPRFTREILGHRGRAVVVRFTNQTSGGRERVLWRFGDGATDSSPLPQVVHEYAPGDYQVVLEVERPPCPAATVEQRLDLREYVPPTPVFEFDAGRWEELAAGPWLEAVAGDAAPGLVEGASTLLNAATTVTQDAAARESLETAAGEKRLGAAAGPFLQELAPVLLERAAGAPPEIVDQLWNFTQIPLAATVYLAAVRQKDLARTGPLARGLTFAGAELLPELAGRDHGRRLKFTPALEALLTAAGADFSKPVVQELAIRIREVYTG
ncbi:MAG: PKD domain-containing protein [Verrucomicrobiales bacterium]|nr:PKD domain-containing protein [Verrucomicrobiales bacterium]